MKDRRGSRHVLGAHQNDLSERIARDSQDNLIELSVINELIEWREETSINSHKPLIADHTAIGKWINSFKE